MKKANPKSKETLFSQDALSLYLSSLPSRTLTQEEEASLLSAYFSYRSASSPQERERAKEAKEALLTYNLPMVVSIAKRYAEGHFNLADLISAGNLGLITALNHFDASQNTRFSTFAYACIENSIRDFVREENLAANRPTGRYDATTKVAIAKELLLKQGITKPSIEEIALVSGLGESTIVKVLSSLSGVSSIESASEEKGEEYLARFLESKGSSIPDSLAQREEDERIERALSKLEDSDRRILVLAYGLEDHNARNNAEIGRILGVSRERVRQIKMRALYRLEQLLKEEK